MTGYNLPPGCNESDIPGNRPEDAAWEKLFEEFWETLTEEERHTIDDSADTDAIVETLVDKAIQYGIDTGERETTKYYEKKKERFMAKFKLEEGQHLAIVEEGELPDADDKVEPSQLWGYLSAREDMIEDGYTHKIVRLIE